MPTSPAPTTPVRIARAAVLLTAFALTLGACDLVREVGVRSWGQATVNQAGTEHTITVNDRSGRVVDVEFGPADAELFEPVTAAPGKPNALDVAWTGGSCDASTKIDIEAFGAALEVAVAIEDNGMPCDAMGLPQVVRLTFAEPLDPAMVKVTQ